MEKSIFKKEYICVWIKISHLLYSRDWHNIVNNCASIKKIKIKHSSVIDKYSVNCTKSITKIAKETQKWLKSGEF